MPNARLGELGGVTNGVDEKSNEGVLRWLGHIKRLENDKIAKRIYVGSVWEIVR